MSDTNLVTPSDQAILQTIEERITPSYQELESAAKQYPYPKLENRIVIDSSLADITEEAKRLEILNAFTGPQRNWPLDYRGYIIREPSGIGRLTPQRLNVICKALDKSPTPARDPIVITFALNAGRMNPAFSLGAEYRATDAIELYPKSYTHEHLPETSTLRTLHMTVLHELGHQHFYGRNGWKTLGQSQKQQLITDWKEGVLSYINSDECHELLVHNQAEQKQQLAQSLFTNNPDNKLGMLLLLMRYELSFKEIMAQLNLHYSLQKGQPPQDFVELNKQTSINPEGADTQRTTAHFETLYRDLKRFRYFDNKSPSPPVLT